MEKKKLLVISDIKKSYQAADGSTNFALRGVSLDIYSGQVLGLLGPNGAGKTTLSSILATLLKPTSGDFFFENKSVFDNLYDYRKIIGFCPQRPNLYSELSIEENIFYAARLFGLDADLAKSRTEELLYRYKLEQYKKQSIKNLSGGYRQRALIARALVHSPKMILFDEPTVGLDPHIRREIWKEIEQLKSLGVAVVLTTHYLDEAEILSDRVCVLDRGVVKFLDTPANLKMTLNKKTLEEVLSHLFTEA